MHGRWCSIGQENYCYQKISGDLTGDSVLSCLNDVDDARRAQLSSKAQSWARRHYATQLSMLGQHTHSSTQYPHTCTMLPVETALACVY